MSESIETKQQYLRSEIIDQGYNPGEFSDFMGSIRGEDGLDLETWSFADLKAVVSQFKSQYSNQQPEPEMPNQYEPQEQKQDQEKEQEQDKEQNNNYNQEGQEEDIEGAVKDTTIPEKKENQNLDTELTFPKEPFEEFEQIIKAEKLEANEITDQNNLFVTISNPVKVKAGIFSSSYYQYLVKTSPVGYKVVRKLSDFTFLYETLPLFNTAVFNPILPHFEFGLKDDSTKKMLYIQNYMNSLVENKFFRTLPIVFNFLTLPQEKWNKIRLENYSKIKPYPLSKMPTLEGEFHININKLEDNNGVRIKDEINKKTEAFNELNAAMDELLTTIEKLSLCYKTLAKSLFDLTKTHKDNEILFGVFNRLLSLTKVWARDYIKERDFLKDEFKYYFKFINKENVSFLKKYEEFKSCREEYKSKYEKVKKLPIKQPKDIELVRKMRRDYGLHLLMINSEYKKLLERQANRCLTQFMKYNENKNIILQNFNNCVKLFNINEDPKNICVDNSNRQEEEQDPGIEQEQEEVTHQNSQEGNSGEN